MRDREATVDRTIEDVKALLLGQARLGAGRKATEVPIGDPRGLVASANGHLLLGEFFFGRVRSVAPDGTLETLADAGSGRVKKNFLKLSDMAEGPDGSLYVASVGTNTVFRIDAAGNAAIVAGNAQATERVVGGALETAILPTKLAVGPDGRLAIADLGANLIHILPANSD